MAANPFDEALEDLPQAQTNPFEAVVQGAQDARAGRLRTVVREAEKTTPDARAEALTLSEQTGIPAEIVERNTAEVRTRAKLAAIPYSQILDSSPALSQWLGEKADHAAIAADDLEPLGALEWIVTAPQRAVQQGIEQLRVANLQTKAIFGELTRAEQDQLNASRFYMTHGGALGAGDSWFRNAVTGSARLLPNLAGALPRVAQYGMVGALEVGAIGAAGGAVMGPGAVAGGLAGAGLGLRAGALYGAMSFGFELEAGLAYDEFSQLRDETGTPMDADAAKAGAIAAGVLNAGLEAFGLTVLAKSIPGIDKLTGAAGRAAIRSALRVPTVRAAMADAITSYGTTLSLETATEVAQRAITIMAGELAKSASGQAIPALSPSEIGQQLGEEAAGAFQSFLLLSAPGPTMQIARAQRQAKAAQQNVALFTAIGEGVAASKTVARRPEAVEQLLARATEKGPIPTVYAPIDTWTTYWQEKGLDPAKVAEELTGDPEAYGRALATGGDLAIKTSVYAVRLAGTEHNAYFAQELRLAPDEMNAREAVAFEQIAAQQDVPATAATSADQIRQQVIDQAVQLGASPQVAQGWGDLYAAGVGTMAESAELDPLAVFQGYGLQIDRGQAQGAAGASGGVTEAGAGAGTDRAGMGTPMAGTAPAAQAPQGAEAAAGGAAAAVMPDGTPAAQPGLPVDGSEPDPLEVAEGRTPGGLRAAAEAQLVGMAASRAATIENRPPDPDTGRLDAGTAEAQTDGRDRATEGTDVRSDLGEQPVADPGRDAEGGGDGDLAESRRLPTADELGAADLDTYPEGFKATDAKSDTVRLTEDTRRELTRIVGELIEFPFQPRTWYWRSHNEKGWTGNAAGGKADIVEGAAGAPVYDDILNHAPLNKGPKGGPAAMVRGTREAVQRAVEKLLASGRISSNLMEGAVRVAERRATGEYRRYRLSAPVLPPDWGVEARPEMVEELSAAIDDALAPVDMLGDQDINEQELQAGDETGDTSFNVEEFGQSLFDDIDPIDPQADTLATGEVQPRLPGAEHVREQDVQTPEMDAPFSLTGEVSKAKKGRQTELFQSAYHGSPHKFERFSLQAIGSGEGAQSYGWGLYFASKREVAEGYRDRLSEWLPEVFLNGTLVEEPTYTASHIRNLLSEVDKGTAFDEAKRITLGDIAWRLKTEELERGDAAEIAELQAAQDAIATLKDGDAQIKGAGRVYVVEIPDDGDYLDWDKPASQQSPKVQAALTALGIKWDGTVYPSMSQAVEMISERMQEGEGAIGWQAVGTLAMETLHAGYELAVMGKDAAFRRWYDENRSIFGDDVNDQVGRDLYAQFTQREAYNAANPDRPGKPQKFASETLAAQGIAGIRYLDGFSRGTGEGSSNYVVFDDKLVEITEFYQSAPADEAMLQAYAASIKEQHGPDLVEFDLRLEKTGDLRLETIAVRRGANRAGLGSRVMQDLTRFADAHGLRIVLSPAEKGYNPDGAATTSSYDRLVKFYRRFGFVPNRGRHKDFTLTAGMYREPTVPMGQQQAPAQPDPFRRWFKQSAVVDDQGQPLVVHHGTGNVAGIETTGFSHEFTDNGNDQYGSGFYFTNRDTTAKGYARRRIDPDTEKIGGEDAPGVLDVYLSIQKPIILDPAKPAGERFPALTRAQVTTLIKAAPEIDDVDSGPLSNWGDVSFEGKATILRKAIDAYVGGNGMALANDFYPGQAEAYLRKYSELTGHDGVITEFESGEKHYVAWFPEQIKSVNNVGTFDPSTPNIMRQEKRGAIRFGPDRQFTISLLERADMSTFLHETGHFFLEVFGDLVDQVVTIPDNQLSPRQRKLLADYGALLRGFGVEHRRDVTTEHHEQFARSFEAYLREGKAPSIELRAAFARFRAWLMAIYRSMRGLNIDLTDEVRGIMDRMLASDTAIAEAEQQGRVQPMFLDAATAGMSTDQFELYRSHIQRASQTARDTLERKILGEVQREQEDLWKAQRADVQAEVEREVYTRPVYQALSAITRGTNPDGTALVEGMETAPMRLSKRILVERFGADRVKGLPPFTFSKEGGIDPDAVATRFGFDSGDALITALADVPAMRAVIETETNRRMLERNGSILLDGSLIERAQAAIANDDREMVIRAELRALAQLRRTVQPFVQQAQAEGQEQVAAANRERAYERRWNEAEARLRIAIAEGRKQVEIDALASEVRNLRQKARGGAATIRAAIPPAGAMRDAAKTQIGRSRFRDINPATFWSASRRAAQKAIEAAARQDFDAAIVEKQKELMNLALYREGMRVRETMDARIKGAKELARPKTRGRLGLAGDSYLDQVDGILDRYEFARVSQTVLDRRASLRRFVAGLEGDGIAVDLPEELLEETRRVNYQELTVEALTGVLDGLDQIVHLARFKNRLLKNAQQRELDDVASQIAESVREHGSRQREGARDRRPSEERRRSVADWYAGHRKLASLLRELDGFVDGGPAWDAIMRPLNDAGSREAEMTAEATTRFAELVERAWPGAQKRRLYEKMLIPAIGKSLSKMERVMVALNWGNESNRDRVRRAEKWTDAQVRSILDTLTATDLDFVQGVFTFLNSYKPAIGEKQKRVFGVEPEWIEPAQIVAAAGIIPGGYFPLSYDDRLSAGAIKALDLESANLARHAAYVNATTKRGHTETRARTVKLPVRLDFGVMFEHVDQVIHDLTHHETLIDIGRILGHRAVQDAILETQGDIVFKQIRGAVRDVAFGDIPAKSGFEHAINHLRMGTTIAMLGWNFTTSALQPMGLFNSVARIGPTWVARGLTRWFRHPTQMVETVHWITEKSAFMRARSRTQQREINEIRNAVGVNTGRITGWVDEALDHLPLITRQGVADSYFFAIQTMQRLADVPTWLGGYEKAMAAGEPEDRAIALADQAVLDSQGGGQIKDLAQVQRGGPMMKLWTNFYSYFNVLYNQSAEAKRRTNFTDPMQVGRLAVDYMTLFIVPATIGYGIRAALRPGQEEDDEDALAWALVMENLSYISGTMLGAREIAGTLAGYYGYEGPAGARAFASLSRLGQQVQQGEVDEALVRSLNETAGILLHYPATQTWRTLMGIMALAEGETEDPMAVVGGPPRN